jgi:Fe-S-cluster-containing dehydrogenase component
MKINRRDFMKIAGLTAMAGLTGVGTVARLKGNSLEAAEYSPPDGALKAKHWAMVIDVSKIKTEEEYQKIIQSCHVDHNVPNFGNPKDEVKWIWTDNYEHTFPFLEHPYMNEEFKEKQFLVLCNHCEAPACVRVCPTKATFKRADGIVVMDYHRCIGCRFCMAACPFGARSFNWRDPRPFINESTLNREYPTRTKGVVEKCTFCVERLEKGKHPLCVENSNGAIVYGDLEDPNSEVRKILASTYTIRRRPELGTGPSIYYVIGGGENARESS